MVLPRNARTNKSENPATNRTNINKQNFGNHLEGFGGLESTREIIRVDRAEFQMIWSRKTAENLPESFSVFLPLLTRLRSFFLSPEAPDPIFLKIPKRCAPEDDRGVCLQFFIWRRMVTFCEKSENKLKQLEQTEQKVKNRKSQETLHRSGLKLMFMGFW